MFINKKNHVQNSSIKFINLPVIFFEHEIEKKKFY
jgi:hypothetical protein